MLPCDDPCLGCTTGFASNVLAFPCGIGYFNHLFGTRTRHYVERLIAKTKPRRVIVSMIYNLDERPGPGWAEHTLRALGYNSNPRRLQAVIRRVHAMAHGTMSLAGTEVMAFPMFDVLDGSDTRDYVQRVEPSAAGGEKMGAALLEAVCQSNGGAHGYDGGLADGAVRGQCMRR